MAKCQSMSIADQLNQGIRYIDLRVCYQNGHWYTCHSLLGSRIDNIISDVNAFLENNPYEITVFKVGYKGDLSNSQKVAFQNVLSARLGNKYLYPEAINAEGELLTTDVTVESTMDRYVSDLLNRHSRAIFINDHGNFDSTYDGNITTNEGTINHLQSKTLSYAPGPKMLEAQVFRPVGDAGYIVGYVESKGCNFLSEVPAYIAITQVKVALESIGVNNLPEFLDHLKGLDKVPADLHQNAQNSRSIFGDYTMWLPDNSQRRPSMMICDFFEEIPFVEACIALSSGWPVKKIANDIVDVPLPSSGNIFEQAFECLTNGIAMAFKVAGYAVEDAGNYIKDNVEGVTREATESALRAAGYAANEVRSFINSVGEWVENIFKKIWGIFS